MHGRSSVARERYEIMYGRALQPPGGALPWQVEKVPLRDRSARAEHEKKRAIEKAVRLAAQAQAAGADLKDLKLPASLQPATKPKPKK